MASYLVRDIAQRKESLEKIAREAIHVEEVGEEGGSSRGQEEKDLGGFCWFTLGRQPGRLQGTFGAI